MTTEEMLAEATRLVREWGVDPAWMRDGGTPGRRREDFAPTSLQHLKIQPGTYLTIVPRSSRRRR